MSELTPYEKIKDELRTGVILIENPTKESEPHLQDLLSDRRDCKYFGIDYVRPDMPRARYVAHRMYQFSRKNNGVYKS